MFVGMEAAELEYQNKTPYDNEVASPWEDHATDGEVMNFLFDEGRVHEVIESYVDTDDEIDEDRAQMLFEAMRTASPAYWNDWFRGWIKRNAMIIRDDFDEWYTKANTWEED